MENTIKTLLEAVLFDAQQFFEIESIINNLNKIYFEKSLEKFKQNFDNLSAVYYNFITASISCYEQNYEEQEQNLIESAQEIFYLRNPVKLENTNTNKALTLRNAEDIEEFETFLDKMLLLDQLNHKTFLNLFIKCPTEYFDKIDDLRETSKKAQRDSVPFTRCLNKAKQISMSFSNG